MATSADLHGSGEPVRLSAAARRRRSSTSCASASSFGRTFRRDGVVGQHRVVVLGHASVAAGSAPTPSIVGATISLNGRTAPDRQACCRRTFPSSRTSTIELWAPHAADGCPSRSPVRTTALAGLRAHEDGCHHRHSRADMDRIGAHAAPRSTPSTNRTTAPTCSRSRATDAAWRRPAGCSQLVAFVLLIACVNVAQPAARRCGGAPSRHRGPRRARREPRTPRRTAVDRERPARHARLRRRTHRRLLGDRPIRRLHAADPPVFGLAASRPDARAAFALLLPSLTSILRAAAGLADRARRTCNASLRTAARRRRQRPEAAAHRAGRIGEIARRLCCSSPPASPCAAFSAC